MVRGGDVGMKVQPGREKNILFEKETIDFVYVIVSHATTHPCSSPTPRKREGRKKDVFINVSHITCSQAPGSVAAAWQQWVVLACIMFLVQTMSSNPQNTK